MKLPPRVRVHKFSRHYYCAEESRLRIKGIQPIYKEGPLDTRSPIVKGNAMDSWLKERPRDPSETILMSKLNKLAKDRGWVQPDEFRGTGTDFYFPRTISYGTNNAETMEIAAHPDDFTVVWREATVEDTELDMKRIPFTQIVEYKSTEDLMEGEYPWFKRSQAEFQLKLYGWVMHPLLKEMGEIMDKQMWLRVYSFNGLLLKSYSVMYPGDEQIEKEIRYILAVWTGDEDPIIPNEFKCKVCNHAFKLGENPTGEGCRIFASGYTFGIRK